MPRREVGIRIIPEVLDELFLVVVGMACSMYAMHRTCVVLIQ